MDKQWEGEPFTRPNDFVDMEGNWSLFITLVIIVFIPEGEKKMFALILVGYVLGYWWVAIEMTFGDLWQFLGNKGKDAQGLAVEASYIFFQIERRDSDWLLNIILSVQMNGWVICHFARLEKEN